MKARRRLQKFATLALAALVAVPVVPAAADDSHVSAWRQYDASGRYTGSARQTAADLIRFYDVKGQFTGTAKRRADGVWRTYDRAGRYSGSLREGKR